MVQPDVTACRALPGYRLWLRFADGSEGIADVSEFVGDGVFAPWSDPDFFARVTIDAGGGTVCWPNGADLDPYVRYHKVTGAPLPGSGEQRAAG